MSSINDFLGALSGTDGAAVTSLIRDLDLSVERVEHLAPSPAGRYGLAGWPDSHITDVSYHGHTETRF